MLVGLAVLIIVILLFYSNNNAICDTVVSQASLEDLSVSEFCDTDAFACITKIGEDAKEEAMIRNAGNIWGLHENAIKNFKKETPVDLSSPFSSNSLFVRLRPNPEDSKHMI